MLKRLLTLFTFSTLLAACAPATPSFNWDASTNPQATQMADPSSSLSMCSALDLNNISWPTSFTGMDKVLLSVAMNLSGSFEGNDGWANLTNNFDGQGMSFGLFNQTLGTGSLQPMLDKMKTNALTQMQGVFSTNNLNNFLGMISNWKQTGSTSQSVTWAVNNLYIGSLFKSDWYTQLKALAVTPYYRSLQVDAATYYHQRALNYVNMFGTREFRSYLFFFDIVIQNGSVPSGAVNALLQKFSTGVYTETQKLNEVLSALLPYVISTYREDVRSRKASIINQTGFVHGETREYNREYCTNLSANI